MGTHQQTSSLRQPLAARSYNDWEDEASTLIDAAPPADDLEELEEARQRMHAVVDRVLDRARDRLVELHREIAQADREHRQMAAELEVVVRHSNQLALRERRREDDTLVEFPRASRGQTIRMHSSRAGTLYVV